MTIQWAPLALERVAEIGAYIYRENPQAAERWIRQIFERVKQLEDFPESGKKNKEADRADIRELSWRLAFTPSGYPAISYWAATTGDLKYVECTGVRIGP